MKNRLLQIILTLSIVFVLAAVAMPALAQDQDPPGVAGRLSYMQGPVSLQPGGVDDWIDGVLNRPLTTSDRVWTDQNARAEVAMGNVKARLDQMTSLTVTDLEDNITQLELDQGSLFVHVRRIYDGESVEIDTPNVAFTVSQPGDYRLDVDPDNDTTYVSVYKGEGQGTGESSGIPVAAGQQAVFSGGNSGNYQISELGDPDDFSNWNMGRNDHFDHSRSEGYVSAGVVGYDDLDDNGDWSEAPQYGHVWYPRVSVGWAPYHTGHWAWIDPWGYTWVDDAPWGYAPFHYGRWVFVGNRWGWAPGPVVAYGSPGWVRPVYAPALVAFVGGGGGFHVGVAIGGGAAVGWVPLGWGEPYYPSYHVSEAYVRNVNVTNTHITNVTNIYNNYTVINNNKTTVINETHYANASVQGAVTVVPQNAMAGGRPVAAAAVKVSPQELQQAKFSAAPGVAPTKEAVLGGKAPATAHVPPASVTSRPVMAQHAPPPAPVKFEAKQQLLANNNGRPLAAQQVQSLPKVSRPAPMTAGKPRPPQAMAAINAAKPKPGSTAAKPIVHPPAAKPGTAKPATAAGAPKPGTPANEPKPGTPGTANKPGTPANEPKPGTPATTTKPGTPANANKPGEPANANKPGEPANANKPGTPAPGRPIPSNTPPPKPTTPPSNNTERPGTAPKPSNEPATRPGNEPNRPGQPTNEAKPVPHPPAKENTPPAKTETAPPAKPGNASQPPAHETNAPHPPTHENAPAAKPAPAPKDNKPANNKDNKPNNKNNKDNKDDKKPN